MQWMKDLKQDIGTRVLSDLLLELPAEDHALRSIAVNLIPLMHRVLLISRVYDYSEEVVFMDLQQDVAEALRVLEG